MFVILSFIKIFHWLVQDRVDFIETTPNVTRLQHARIASFALVLLVGVVWWVGAVLGPCWAGVDICSSHDCLYRNKSVDSLLTRPSPAARACSAVPYRQALDLAFLHFSLSRTLASGVSVHLLFAFEYTVQASTILVTFAKYCM